MRSLLIPALIALPLAASPAVQAKVDALNNAFAAAMTRGDAAAVAAFYSEDAQLYFFKGTTLRAPNKTPRRRARGAGRARQGRRVAA